MSNLEKVSIVMASYNHVESIKKAIDSVLQQTFKNYKIIIVDDGSTDGSVEVIEKYVSLDKKVDAHFERHKGLMNTYLKGFSECKGDYIAFCDCDDYWIDKDKLKKQVSYMESHGNCGLCFTKAYTEIDKERIPMSITANEINEKISFDSLLSGRANIHAQSYMIRKSTFDKHINFQHFIDKDFRTWDYPIVLELIKHTKFHCLDFYSAVWAKNKESVTSTRNRIRRFKYLLNNYKIKSYYIKKYDCKSSTLLCLFYRIIRDIYSIIFKRWK
ncbi:MAG: glycosyltransferase family 2 protein [Candidatus Hodarchaeota archaeon]